MWMNAAIISPGFYGGNVGVVIAVAGAAGEVVDLAAVEMSKNLKGEI